MVWCYSCRKSWCVNIEWEIFCIWNSLSKERFLAIIIWLIFIYIRYFSLSLLSQLLLWQVCNVIFIKWLLSTLPISLVGGFYFSTERSHSFDHTFTTRFYNSATYVALILQNSWFFNLDRHIRLYLCGICDFDDSTGFFRARGFSFQSTQIFHPFFW